MVDEGRTLQKHGEPESAGEFIEACWTREGRREACWTEVMGGVYTLLMESVRVIITVRWLACEASWMSA